MDGSTSIDRRLLAACERLGRALRVVKQQTATRHRVTPLQVDVLEVLAARRGLRIGEIAAELDVTQPTVSDATNALAGKGLVARTPDPADGRASVISLTDTGATVAEEIAEELSPLRTAEPATAADDKARALRVLLGEIRRLQRSGVITIDRSCFTCRHYQAPSTTSSAHCALLNEQLTDHSLRVDCPEHEPQST